ncbi:MULTISPECIES: hypothetical protein [unclassified Aureimonas]|uniref:hypothetical protein n=1 Tax=unclassified Aureimonas TaxID=2615206 RepID=UPI0006FE9A36|nr:MULTISPECIES: hypothetical protein [unclassified Aureimonas]KQT57311.1 hypothetical protein ASG62_08150 [Aureimonas sp. Leaf427]KQT76991.1 hypothetical protein ASG54_12015 [Aureimonas sp. Leaf460]
MQKPTNNAAVEISTLVMLSPLVIASRMTEFWLTAASPTAKSRRETVRMVTEKMQAVGESAMAVNMAVTGLAIQSAAAAATGTVRQTHNDVDTILTAALKPYSSRVTANRKRLST